MAKLTARFEMVDKISKKMRSFRGELDMVNKRKKAMSKPAVFEVRDRATKQLKNIRKTADKLSTNRTVTLAVADKMTKPMAGINKYLQRKFPKSHTLLMQVKDNATRDMRSINDFIKRRMPRAHEIMVQARDRSRTVLERIRRYLGKNILGAHMFEVLVRDKAMPTLQRIASYTKRQLARGYNFSVRAIDIATKTVGRIASYTGRVIPKVRNFTVRAIDSASRVIGSVKRALFSVPTMITVGLAVVGLGSVGASTLGAAMNFEGYEVAMQHWLDGNKKEADKLVNWMGQFADKTPFSSPDLFPALSRGVGLTSGDVNQAKSLLEIATNMAALTPGRTVADAMEALGGAQMGQFEMMKGYNVAMTKEEYDNMGGWESFIGMVDKEFKDGALKFSQTASGQVSTLKGYTSSIFREAGVGILESMTPRLNAITNWLDNNQEKWGEWKNTVQQAGEQGAEWIFSKLEGAFSYLRDNYLENDEFKNLGFEGKVKFIMEDLGAWWDKTGRPWLVEVSKDVGEAVFNGVTWGIKEGFKGIGSMWADAFKDPSVGSFASAGIATAIGASVISLLVSPLIAAFKIGGSIIRAALSAGRWIGGLFGKGKGKGPKPPVPPVSSGGTQKKSPTTTNRKRTPVYTNPWFNKGERPQTNMSKQGGSKLTKGLDSFGKGLGAFAKRVPVLGTILGAGAILTAPKEQKGKAIGSVGGGLGGAATGAAIGSIIPGIGTAIGGIIGGIAGSFGGEKLGGWLGDNWDTIKTKASGAATSVGDAFNTTKEKISNTLFSGDWWSEKWNGVKDWTSEKWQNATDTWDTVKESISSTIFSGDWWSGKWESVKETATSTIFSAGWWAEQAGKVYGFLEGTIFSGEWWSEKWEVVKEVTAGTMFDPSWWGEKWQGVKDWTSEKWESFTDIWDAGVEAISSTVFSGEWWSEKWQGVKDWTSEKWSTFTDVWDAGMAAINSTVFNGAWWGEKWQGVKDWTSEKWDGFTDVWDAGVKAISDTVFNGEWWKGHWDDTVGWAQEKWDGAQEVWDSVKTSLGDTLFDGSWWKGKWDDVSGWAQEKLSGVGTLVSGLVDNVKERFSSGRDQGNETAEKYANGGMITRPHLGLVGEAGPEMIIPLSSGRRGRAMQLYNQTGEMLGVKPYANGGLAGGSVKAVKPQTVQAAVNAGSVSIQGMGKEAKLYGESYTNAVASGINNNVVPINKWKNNNIENPMQSVVKEAVGFGSGTVTSFSTGQNSTQTKTDAHLDTQVKAPFKVIEGGASEWGKGTVSGFRSGQDSSLTGTRPYLVSNVHTPFEETKAKGSGWGSGAISQFVAGMRSEDSKVQEASKYLAEQVDKTFKAELGINSPSRVMEKDGMWTALGIVKGFGKVDIKAFAEKQAGSLAAAFSGMGAIGGNVSEWIRTAMMITDVPSSWLGPLSVIAQKESGGNPRAQNNWDINAKRGIPSKGLMQTIGPTFNAYKGNGMEDIFNPIHNAVAAINYIKSRYGNVFNVPGIKSMASGGAYRGYWKGTKGPLRSGETAWVGERGPELVNLPRGSEVLSNRESKRVASNQVSAATGNSRHRSSGGSKGSVILNFNGDNHFYNDEDEAGFVGKVKSAVEQIVKDEYNEGGEVVVND
ncbi:SLT domain-containing protein [Gracilibacillus orientalis]|uniref:SLT domain-containing protein n=1 Tax=Gracilibacillus orientalis TaxID=334253 RepID=A0A1I4PNE5_9BACI|nr:transglycosylase SLT domain-containing protein [Gracilibacillus orientalis]SFM29194.1 SLT domain-containing protein [Gracilibacillus orientalis]